MTKKISELTDRELLEQIFATQVVLMQSVYRIDDFLNSKDEDFGKHVIHKDAAYKRLNNELYNFWAQYDELTNKKN